MRHINTVFLNQDEGALSSVLGVATPRKRRLDAPDEGQGNVALHAIVPHRMAIPQTAALSSIARATAVRQVQEVAACPSYSHALRHTNYIFDAAGSNRSFTSQAPPTCRSLAHFYLPIYPFHTINICLHAPTYNRAIGLPPRRCVWPGRWTCASVLTRPLCWCARRPGLGIVRFPTGGATFLSYCLNSDWLSVLNITRGRD